jgi:hypothetical protein
MSITGLIIEGAGVAMFSIGIYSLPLFISGLAATLLVGLPLVLIGSLALSRKGWKFLAAAIQEYNASSPPEPVLPGFAIFDY